MIDNKTKSGLFLMIVIICYVLLVNSNEVIPSYNTKHFPLPKYYDSMHVYVRNYICFILHYNIITVIKIANKSDR